MLHADVDTKKTFTVDEVRERAKALLVKFGVLEQEPNNLYFGADSRQYLTPYDKVARLVRSALIRAALF